MNEWISIKNKLPHDKIEGNEISYRCAVICEQGYKVAYYMGIHKKSRVPVFIVYNQRYHGEELRDVTHWLPLPEPPESESDAE